MWSNPPVLPGSHCLVVNLTVVKGVRSCPVSSGLVWFRPVSSGFVGSSGRPVVRCPLVVVRCRVVGLPFFFLFSSFFLPFFFLFVSSSSPPYFLLFFSSLSPLFVLCLSSCSPLFLLCFSSVLLCFSYFILCFSSCFLLVLLCLFYFVVCLSWFSLVCLFFSSYLSYVFFSSSSCFFFFLCFCVPPFSPPFSPPFFPSFFPSLSLLFPAFHLALSLSPLSLSLLSPLSLRAPQKCPTLTLTLTFTHTLTHSHLHSYTLTHSLSHSLSLSHNLSPSLPIFLSSHFSLVSLSLSSLSLPPVVRLSGCPVVRCPVRENGAIVLLQQHISENKNSSAACMGTRLLHKVRGWPDRRKCVVAQHTVPEGIRVGLNLSFVCPHCQWIQGGEGAVLPRFDKETYPNARVRECVDGLTLISNAFR